MKTRIHQIKDHYGLSVRAFAIKCGMNQPTLDRMLKGINALNLNCISSILRAFPEISSEWLMRGEGEMLIKNKPNSAELDRIDKLIDTITTLQDTIKSKNDAIAMMAERIKQLESQTNLK